MQLILQFDPFLLDPPFELMIALAFVVYVILSATFAAHQHEQRLDQSVRSWRKS